MPKFAPRKPSPELSVVAAPPEPAGLDAFMARAEVTPPPEPSARRGQGRVLPSSPMPVRFPPEVKAALEKLARQDRRSQQQILELVAFPAILSAAERLP